MMLTPVNFYRVSHDGNPFSFSILVRLAIV